MINDILIIIGRYFNERKLILILLILFCILSLVYVSGKIVHRFLVRQKILKLLVQRKIREIEQKNEALKRNNMIKTRLISIISHDLISPLRFIHLSTKNLIDEEDKIPAELRREILDEVSHSSKELELLSTNILNWIKYQNENRRLMKEEFNLHEMAENIFRIFKTISREKQATFINEIHNEFVLYQYQEPIKIVLYNLILNALNFTEEGNITVSGGKSHKGILIKVKDEGQGMSEDQIKNVMSENIIVSSANVENRKGNGLGYLIIKDLLKLVDAKFIIKSKKGKGTMVTILLPVDR